MIFPHDRVGSRAGMAQQLMTDINHTYQYGVYVMVSTTGGRTKGHNNAKLSGGGAIAFKRRLSDGVIVQTFDLTTLPGNPFSLPLEDMLDDHFGFSLGIDADNVLHVVGNQHENVPDESVDTQNYCTCDNVAALNLASSWTYRGNPPPFGSDAVINGIGGYVYSHFDRMTDGTLLWSFAQSPGGRNASNKPLTNSAGRCWLFMKRVSGTWVSVLPGSNKFCVTTRIGSTYTTDTVGGTDQVAYNTDGSANRVYIIKIVIDPGRGNSGGDRLHAAGVWRTHEGDANFQQQPWYLYSDDVGVTWKTMTGVTQPMPITWYNRVASATINTATNPVPVFSQGIGIDPITGYPHILMLNAPIGLQQVATPQNDDLFWNGTAWDATRNMTYFDCAYFVLKGHLYFRQRGGTLSDRIRIQDKTSGTTSFLIGPRIRNLNPNPDPVRLREQNIYSILMGDGDTPIIYEFGPKTKAHP